MLTTLFRRTSLAALLLASFGAHAGMFDIVGTTDSAGARPNVAFTGSFELDDSLLKGNGFEELSLSQFQLTVFDQLFNGSNAGAIAPTISYQDGVLLGLSGTFNAEGISLSFVPGFTEFAQASLEYVVSTGMGSASYAINPAAAVPEPESWALMLGGLAAMGFLARRQQRV